MDRTMMVSRDVLHALVDSLPEAEIATAERFRRGLAQADAGDTVACRDYSEMVEKLLD